MNGEVGHDNGLRDYRDNVTLAALTTYFISNTGGDVAGTGAAVCYSGKAIRSNMDCYGQPPVHLTDWKKKAFLDMCESTAEFLHRAKFLLQRHRISHASHVDTRQITRWPDFVRG